MNTKQIIEFHEVGKEFLKHNEVATTLPLRADVGSAGYDFFLKEDVTIPAAIGDLPGQAKTFTDIKAEMPTNVVLSIYLRSSIGIKNQISLSNGTGIVDSTYFENESNDGNIGLFFTNHSTKEINLKAGDRIAQGVFSHYLTTESDNVTSNTRTGGFGSSGK